MQNEPRISINPIPEEFINWIKTIVSIYAIGSLLPLSSSSMGRRLCFKFMLCERRILKTEAESVEDIVAANSMAVISDMVMLTCLNPEIQYIKRPVKSVVSNTPTVESSIPCGSTGRISANLVSMPPENRIMLNATMPMNCASPALWNCSPSPSLPKNIPTNKNTSNVGTPKR